jgi:hypothetical protein
MNNGTDHAAAAEAPPAAKQPRGIDQLVASIRSHPDYNDKIDRLDRFIIDGDAKYGRGLERSKYIQGQHNAWLRKVWNFLYLGVPTSELSSPSME